MGHRILKISTRFFADFFRPGWVLWEVVKDALPPDVEILNVTMQFNTNDVAFKLQSAEWEPVPDGQSIPSIQPQMRTARVPARYVEETLEIIDQKCRADDIRALGTWRDKDSLL